MFDDLRYTVNDVRPLHHAYLALGELPVLASDLRGALREMTGREVEGNPDISWWKGESFGIEEARELRAGASAAALGEGGRRFFIIESYGFTDPAQNALLKTLEDPPVDVHFFLLAPSRDLFLPTLLSRFFILEQRRIQLADADRIRALAFLNAAPAKRLELVAPMVKKTDEPDEKKEQKRAAAAFLDALERALEEKLLANPRAREAVVEIEAVKGFLSESAGNPRLILEHLSLVL